MNRPSVTYMTVVCNRGEFLAQNIREQFLSGHFDLEGIDFDIVIVDDGSSDGAVDKIKSLCEGKLGIPLTYVYLKRRVENRFYSDSTVINTGVTHSKGDFIYIASADCYICSSDVFQRLVKLEADRYMNPHMLRFDQNNSVIYKFCVKNWMHPSKCMEHLEKVGTIWGAYYYDRIFGTGLVGLHRKTFHDIGGIEPIRTTGGTDYTMRCALEKHAITIDEDISDVLVIHFPVPYAVTFIPGAAKYLDEHYGEVDGITIIGEEHLDIHNLTL